MPVQVKNFLVATDGSESADRAIDVAAAMAKAASGTLLIVTVGNLANDAERDEFRRAESNIAGPADVFAQQTLEEARKRAGWSGVTPTKTLIRWGDPAETIMSTIMDEKVDAIVIGRRGRGRLSGLLLGSVSQKIASLSPCVAIIVP